MIKYKKRIGLVLKLVIIILFVITGQMESEYSVPDLIQNPIRCRRSTEKKIPVCLIIILQSNF
jgi:hypothetical protein